MALPDVKEYYYTVLNQYVETEHDLQDFEQALKDGHITEDQLEAAKEDVAAIKQNLDRIQYIMFLFSLPKTKQKRKKLKKIQQPLEDYFNSIKVDTKSIQDENSNVLTHLRAELKALKEKNKE